MTSVSECVRNWWPRLSSSRRSSQVVIDLAVEDDLHLFLRRRHRLLAGRDVDDRQPAVAERRVRVDEEAGAVGPAMLNDRGHALDARTGRLGRVAREIDESSYAAHGSVALRRLREHFAVQVAVMIEHA